MSTDTFSRDAPAERHDVACRDDSIIHADCLDVLRDLPPVCVDLVYLDPPFNTGVVKSGANGTFGDRWANVGDYVAFLRPRIAEMHRALKPTGSILLHCDWRTCHHLRALLEEIFGPENFVNHVIWSYGLGGSSPRRFARKHDDILFYGRSSGYHFNPPMVPATSVRMKGKRKKATDVIEIPAINNMAAERVGYPTQKPLALLELLVRACSPPGGLVLDPFCGSGTTLVAAQALGRRFLGVDSGADAVAVSSKRCGITAGQREQGPCTPGSAPSLRKRTFLPPRS
jgi:site-specific DNA-methyltransferase (adenine-specific)